MDGKSDAELVEKSHENRTVRRLTSVSGRLIFEAIRREGNEELNRTLGALWWSGIAAGLLIAFSVWGEALLRSSLPDTEWRYILENFGYSLGFLLVILGRMQLFTENTITTVVPLVMRPAFSCLWKVARLWGVVLAANIVGAFAVASFMAFTPVLSDEVRLAVTELSHHATGMPAIEGMVRGIPAGVLIAALVWMMPAAGSSRLMLIIVFTWLIALGDFTHIIAGSVEMAFLLVQGELQAMRAIFGFFLPVLVGNIVGGTVVFTLLTSAQIKYDIEENGAKS
ncbi:formate/nitrite transporter family protein [Roseovarius aestuariivivens]|uniref:formate/nitrite transporter family protein n=1 Tax=Roseovarius aestuariivivens TaxID=1888910 RepID=UPI00108128C0|nr:formate/nitrite transporter family protein [Roseovarius aestuariivivens]